MSSLRSAPQRFFSHPPLNLSFRSRKKDGGFGHDLFHVELDGPVDLDLDLDLDLGPGIPLLPEAA
jgi:hypothetical protein